jgi:PAS domain S-box-containing protein
MPNNAVSTKQLLLELDSVRARLEQAEDALRAIRSGEVDALVIPGVVDDQIFTLKGADQIYRILIENMSEGTLTMTAEGMIMYANRRFAEILKAPLEKVIGSMIHTWIAPDSRRMFHALLSKGVNENRREELELAAGNGTKVPVHLSLSNPFINDMADFFCMLVTDLTEINQRKKAEAQWQSSAQYNRSLIEASLDPLVMISANGKITDANTATEQVTGVDRARLIGSDFADYFTDPEKAREGSSGYSNKVSSPITRWVFAMYRARSRTCSITPVCTVTPMAPCLAYCRCARHHRAQAGGDRGGAGTQQTDSGI